jgi:hypothetical protein
MKTRFLFAHRFKYLGWGIFAIGFVLVLMHVLADFTENNILSKFNFFESGHFFSKWTTIKNFHKNKWTDDNGKSGFTFEDEDIMGELIMSMVIIGFVLMAFSRERFEDEWIAKVRLESLVIGLYALLASIFVIIWIIYGLDFWVILNYCLLIPLLVFIVRFYWVVHIKPRFENVREGSIKA